MDTDTNDSMTTLERSEHEAIESSADPKAVGEGSDGSKWHCDLHDELEGETAQS